MSTQLKIKAPKAPLKGKGFKREAFSFRANHHADALRVAFWDALPPEHKTVACVGVRAKGYHSFGKFISPEAMTVFRKAVLSEGGGQDIAECIECNAQLFAAAPDLLDALTDLVGGCGKEGDLFSGEAMQKAREAIAKAEGRAL